MLLRQALQAKFSTYYTISFFAKGAVRKLTLPFANLSCPFRFKLPFQGECLARILNKFEPFEQFFPFQPSPFSTFHFKTFHLQ